jgi:circadian clock protein KaiC
MNKLRNQKSSSARKPATVPIRKLPTGVRGLDEILGGGLPEYSFNLITGGPGCGKTTLAHQIIFANATPKRPALYFTILGEPAIKMLRYQQQFSFFDVAKLNTAVRFINLSHVAQDKDRSAVFEAITREVEQTNPGFVVVDSFRTVEHSALEEIGDIETQAFVQRLSQYLSAWEATTFLIGEYANGAVGDHPVFTVADGMFWLSQVEDGNSIVRKLRVVKLRGQASAPGLHSLRITEHGVEAFPRTRSVLLGRKTRGHSRHRISLGIPELDKMLGGGIFEGDSLLLTGPSGTGKSAIATQFLAAGLRKGERGVAAVFEESSEAYLRRADEFGLGLLEAEKKGHLKILKLRPLDLSVDEALRELLDAILEVGATRLVIDSLVGFEMALAPGFRTEFRESLYRMITALTEAGVTVVSTVEVEESFVSLSFSRFTISFLTDDIIRLRYVEIDGQLRKIMTVVKMRGGNHSKDVREYIISDQGVVIINPHRVEYYGLVTGIPQLTGPRPRQQFDQPPEKKALAAPPAKK